MDEGELKEILKGISGFRDYFPEDFSKINTILNVMKKTSERFGYEEYEGPSLEFAKLIEIKSGQEIMGETFLVLGKDERELVLRPEQTPTLARMIVNEHQRYPKPIRWYSIPRIFRNETPQKGRVREFFQFNADIIGVDDEAADAEIIALTTNIIKDAGLKDDEFICVINSRELIQGYIEHLAIDTSFYVDVIKTIDSREKHLQAYIEQDLAKKGVQKPKAKDYAMQIRTIWHQDPDMTNINHEELAENVHHYLEKINQVMRNVMVESFVKIGLNKEQSERLYEFASIRGDPTTFIQKMKNIDLGVKAEQALQKMEKLALFLRYFDIEKNCEYNASIARGLDYYTGIVFEFIDQTGSVVRAIAGGGRYDQLVNTFGGGKIPATGVGMGETVLLAILEDLGRITSSTSPAHVYVAPINKKVHKEASKIVQNLRDHFKVIFNPYDWKLGNHLEDASSRNIPFVIIVGTKDLEKESLTIRDMETGDQYLVPINELCDKLFSLL